MNVATKPYLCIPLRGKRGGVAYVNESMWPLVDGTNWYMTKNGYAFSPKYGLMHRRMFAAESGEHIDHKNFNRIDNRLSNLRGLLQWQNNTHCRKRNTPWPYKGVRMVSNRWQARITVKRRTIHVGTFDTAEDAARAYDRAAKAHFGDLAVLNFGGKP